MPTYLDANGNPIKQYLDPETGEPVGAKPPASPFDALPPDLRAAAELSLNSVVGAMGAKIVDDRRPKRVRTRMPVPSAEVKRRAAAGEPILQKGDGLRPPTALDNANALFASGVAGAAEGLAGTVALAGDAVVTPYAMMIAGVKALREGKGYKAAVGKSLGAALPISRTASAAADDLEARTRNALGIEDVATTSAAPVVRLGVDVAMPGPTISAARRSGTAAAETVAREGAETAARIGNGEIPDLPPAEAAARESAPAETLGMTDEVQTSAPIDTSAAPLEFNAENLKTTFGLGDEEASAAEAIADAMGLDKTKIALAKGGGAADTALQQADEARWYYDNVEQSLDTWQPKGTPEQLLAHLKKSKGALDEAETIGLKEWLAGKPSVTRDEVRRFLEENRVEVDEVVRTPKDTAIDDLYTDYASGGANYREVLLKIRSKKGDPYLTPHFNEPNVIAHVRMRDHQTPDGRRILFVEELQSDWHQAGRQRGYHDPNRPWEVVDEGEDGSDVVRSFASKADAERYADEETAFGYVRRAPRGERVPDGPFKGDGWKKLALKRVLREAAEGDYDGIAWTPGAVQNARFSKEVQVEGVTWQSPEDGLRTINIDSNSPIQISVTVDDAGRVVDASEAQYRGRALTDMVPPEVAASIRATPSGSAQAEFTMGGQGMRGFYDREMVNLLNDLAKRYGQRSETIQLRMAERGVEDVHFLPTPADMRNAVAAAKLPLFQGAKAAVEFTEAGKAIISALKSPDVSSAVHELAHTARRFLFDRKLSPDERLGITDADIAVAEKWAGAKNGEWDTAAEEKFARGFERYLLEGKAPTQQLAALFDKFKEWLAGIYRQVSGSSIDVEISPEMREVFDKLVVREKYARPSSINLDRLAIPEEAKLTIAKTAREIGPELEEITGAKLTESEVLEAAAHSEILRRGTTREATVKSAATLLRTRQHLAAMAETGQVTPEFIATLKVLSAEATRRGRELRALAIHAEPELYTAQTEIIKKLEELGVSTDEIVKAAEGVDFRNAKQAAEFYRKFVKPTFSEILSEYRYINLLSSPKTHIVNAFSNMLQTAVVRPAVRLVSGAIDNMASRLTGQTRKMYMRQVPAYYRGALSGIAEASDGALAALRGKRALTNLDLRQIPTGTKILKPFQIVPRALEAGDVFFRTLVEAGEREALARGYKIRGKEINQAKIAKKAADTAAETIFRKPLDTENASGHGVLLAHVDRATAAIQQLRKVPGISWFIPFVETPMNIFKQGIEFSPIGMATLVGSSRPVEQVAKSIIGTTVFAGAGLLALEGRTTWSVPRNEKDRAAFYAAGMQPYAVKIGDIWVSFSKLGPLAYPMAFAAAMRQYTMDDPTAERELNGATALRIMRGIAEFFSDQSYVAGIGDIVAAARGEESGWNRMAANLPKQLVPLAGLQRWVAQIVDPIYRKAPKGVSIGAIIDNIKRDIPFASKSLPPQKRPDGKPSERPMPLVNAVSPLNMSQEDPAERKRYDSRAKAAQGRARAAKKKREAKERAEAQAQ